MVLSQFLEKYCEEERGVGLHDRLLLGVTRACTFLTTDFQEEMIAERKGEEYQTYYNTQILLLSQYVSSSYM